MTAQKARILDIAVNLARMEGFRNVTRSMVAISAGVVDGTVSYHFKTMAKLRDAIVKSAIDQSVYPVIAQALVEGHRHVRNLSPSVRAAALKSVA